MGVPELSSIGGSAYFHRPGLEGYRLHDACHAHATLMLQHGVHPKVVSERLGQRDPATDCVSNTYFCEKIPQEFTFISELIGSHEQGFLGDFQEMILFEDDDETIEKSINDAHVSYSRPVRYLLNVKERHERFCSTAPFDLINLDLCGRFFPPKAGVISPMVRTIRRLLALQAEGSDDGQQLDKFTMFITTHVESRGTNPEAVDELAAMIEHNRSLYVGFEESLINRFGSIPTSDIPSYDFDGFYNVALPKMIVGEAYNLGWMVDLQFTGTYERSWLAPPGKDPAKYRMLALVATFSRITEGQLKLGHQSAPGELEYSKRISMIVNTPLETIKPDQERVAAVSPHLAEVVKSRTDYQDEILSRS